MQTHAWERPLLLLANEAMSSLSSHDVELVVDDPTLQQAHDHCRRLTSRHSKSFYLASSLLPMPKRQASRSLYAFCRVSDDIVDEATQDVAAKLETWRNYILANKPAANDWVALAWRDTHTRYAIPPRYAEQLIDGVARDLHQTRYATFSELTTYAYGVASTVGLMSMHIIGFAGPEAVPYAIKLGVALQMTNILRDVQEDWESGRVYLPQTELHEFGLSEVDLANGVVDDRWRAFMQFQIKRNRRLYAEAWPGIGLLNREGRFAIAAAAKLYEAILTDIEAHDYDVFQRRAFVSNWRKLSMLPAIWRQSRHFV